MRIFLLIHQFPPERYGGAERHVQQLATELGKRHDVLVYTQSCDAYGESPEDAVVGYFRLRRFRDRRATAAPALSADLLHTARTFMPDVVHVHHGIGFSPSALAHLSRDCPSVLTLHDYWWQCARIRLLFRGQTPCPGPYPLTRCVDCYEDEADRLIGEAAGLSDYGPLAGIARRARRYVTETRKADAARNVAQKGLSFVPFSRLMFFHRRQHVYRSIVSSFRDIISPSKYLVKRYRQAGFYLPRERTHIVPYGIDPAEIPAPPAARREGPVRFGLIGHLNHEKGVGIAMRAIRDVAAGAAELHVHGGYDGPKDAAANVVFHGAFVPDHLPRLLADIDALIVPSIWVENSPKVIHEAFAAGVPVIAADHGALPELVGEGRGGFLFRAQDAMSLSALMHRIVLHPEALDDARAGIPPPETIGETSVRIEEVYSRAIGR
ncbi:glycosyltransferase [bacterium]|nr:glycosyltransferase [bacterium]